ncbi:O-antigen ligase family protein [Maribacter chungangensis]|uniref:O-antigen ligase family protein n=1 Tax=Maribacter chungangensis TaxID=1069117 RepID=A0ABW3AXX1_9FLAO
MPNLTSGRLGPVQNSKMKHVGVFMRVNLLSIAMALCIGLLPWNEKWNTISIIVLFAGVLFDAVIKKRKYRLDLKRFFVGSGVFFVALLWLPLSDDLSTGWSYLERLLTAALFPLLFSMVVKYCKLNIRYIFFAFMASCLFRYLFFLGGLLEFELLFILDYWNEVLIQFNQFFKQKALHPSYFSMYLGFCAIICFYFYSISKSLRQRSFWIGSLFVFLLINLTLASKMPFVATIAALIFGVAFHLYKTSGSRGRKRYIVGLVVGLVAFGVYIYKVPNVIKQDIGNYYDYFSGKNSESLYDYNQYGTNYSLETWNRTNRIHIWKSSISLLKANFLLGVGTGDIRAELNNQYLVDGHPYLSNKDANTHNQYLDYFIKFGIFGFGILLFCFYTYVKSALNKSNPTYLMFLILALMCMFTENILSRQLGIVFFFFFQSLFFFSESKEVKTSACTN